MSLVVARKQALAGSPPAADKPTSSSVSPRRETGSPLLHKKGPPVAKKPARGSIPEPQNPGSPRKAESPHLTRKPFESVPSVNALNGSVPTGSLSTGSPVASRREPVQPQDFEPVVQIVQQSPREAARKISKQSVRLYCLTNLVSSVLEIYDFLSWLYFVHSCFPDINPASKSPHNTDHSRSRMCDRDSQRQHGPGTEHSWRCRYIAGKSLFRYIIISM